MSGSTTPVSSAASYSDADVRAQSVWQAEVNKLKVAQLDELLNAKGVKPKGTKPEKAMEKRDRRLAREAAGGPPAARAPEHAAPQPADAERLFFNAK